MSRVLLTGIMSLAMVLTACQQTRLSSVPQPKAANTVNSVPPPGSPPGGRIIPPPRVPPPQVNPPPGGGPVVFNPPPVPPGHPIVGPLPGGGGNNPPPIYGGNPPGQTTTPPPNVVNPPQTGGSPTPPPRSASNPPPQTLTNPPPQTTSNPPPPGVTNPPQSNPPPPGVTNPPRTTSTPPPPGVTNPPITTSNPPAPVVSNPPVASPPVASVAPPFSQTPVSGVGTNALPLPRSGIQSNAMAANFQAPLGKEWNEIQSSLPTQPQVCVGQGCPTQTYAPAPPPIAEDCTITKSCLPGAATPTPLAPGPTTVSTVDPTPAAPAAAPGCTPIPLTGKQISNKLDILLVMDTSASMRGGHETGTEGELGEIIPEMSSFVNQLDPNTDIRIGMLLGHAPANKKSPGNVHGQLLRVDTSDRAVIDYNDIRKECKKNTRDCVNKKVAAILQHKLKNMPPDHTEAQGEALFYSLYDAITKNAQTIQNQGMLRPDATLAVIFMSDEQEVCYDYTGTGFTPAQVPYRDPVTKKMTKGQDPHEKNFFDHECQTAANGQPLNANRVWDALKQLKYGDVNTLDTSKLVVTAVIYTTKDIPAELQNQHNEIEMGHGYVDLIQLAKGRAADMSQVDRSQKVIGFAPQMEYLGKYASFKMQFPNEWTCASFTHPDTVNMTSIQLKIHDSTQNRDIAVFSAQCVAGQPCADGNGNVVGANNRTCNGDVVGAATGVIQADPHGSNPALQVSVNPDQLSDALQACGFKQGEVQIEFNTLSSAQAP